MERKSSNFIRLKYYYGDNHVIKSCIVDRNSIVAAREYIDITSSKTESGKFKVNDLQSCVRLELRTGGGKTETIYLAEDIDKLSEILKAESI